MHIKYKLLLWISLLAPLAAQAQVYGDGLVVNEIMASSDSLSGLPDPAGQYEDWIELYNNGSTTLNLENFQLSDKPNNPAKWTFPAGITIAAGGYLIIWCDEDQNQEGVHCNFKLSADGEDLVLSNPFGERLDSITWGPQQTNKAYARRPNGTGNFVVQNATFGFNNDQVNSTGQRPVIRNEGFFLSPNPAQSEVLVSWRLGEVPKVSSVAVIDNLGRVVRRPLWNNSAISLAGLSAGTYLVRVSTDRGVFGQQLVKH